MDGSAPPGGLVAPFLDVDVQVLSFVVFDFTSLDGPVGFFGVDLVFPLAVDEAVAVDDHN